MYIYIHMCMLSCESDARTWPEGGTLCGYKSSVVACRWMKRKSASHPTTIFPLSGRRILDGNCPSAFFVKCCIIGVASRFDSNMLVVN